MHVNYGGSSSETMKSRGAEHKSAPLIHNGAGRELPSAEVFAKQEQVFALFHERLDALFHRLENSVLTPPIPCPEDNQAKNPIETRSMLLGRVDDMTKALVHLLSRTDDVLSRLEV